MVECERHAEIAEAIDDLDDRVKYLELRDATTSLMLENLITRVDKLVKTIEDFMAATRRGVVGTGGAIIATLFGFLIWYIQTH